MTVRLLRPSQDIYICNMTRYNISSLDDPVRGVIPNLVFCLSGLEGIRVHWERLAMRNEVDSLMSTNLSGFPDTDMPNRRQVHLS